MEESLNVFYKGELIYISEKKWLHPLIDLENYLKENDNIKRENLYIKDKIIGRAAAFLLVKLGVKKVDTEVISELGKDIFEKFNIEYTYDELIDKINCKTENLLKDINKVDKAYEVIMGRVER
ncbi:MAG: DUF1893 domain-containing protein [Fusobacteriota bacterium]